MKRQQKLMGDLKYRRAGAHFDDARIYRYWLWRQWGDGGGLPPRRVLWIMLNPSTADEHVLDPTLRRCESFARQWGYDGFDVCNLFALRSTDPKALYGHADPIGPDNDRMIAGAAHDADLVIAGWGIHGKYSRRGGVVTQQLYAAGVKVQCLGTTADGFPKHPLYLAGETAPRPYVVEFPAQAGLGTDS